MQAYLIRITAAAILASVLRKLAPQGIPGRGTRLGAGLLVILTALGPLGEVNILESAREIVSGSYVAGYWEDAFQETTNDLMEELIKENAEAYILDKAQAMGAEVQAEVETVVQNGCPIPWRVRLEGSVTLQQKEKLARMLRDDLGIPEERQMW